MRRTLLTLAAVLSLGLSANADLRVTLRDAAGKDVQTPITVPVGVRVVVEEVPGKTPPAPAKGEAKYLLLVRDDSKPLTAAQRAILDDAALRGRVAAAGLAYYACDVSEDVMRPPPTGRDFRAKHLDAHGLSAPCVVLTDGTGRFLKGAALPADAAGVAAFIAP